MRNENWLGICTVQLFVVPTGGKRLAVYLARREGEVKALHRQIYGEAARRVRDVSGKMDASVYCEETEVWQSFRELKRQVVEFPYFVGEM